MHLERCRKVNLSIAIRVTEAGKFISPSTLMSVILVSLLENFLHDGFTTFLVFASVIHTFKN